MPIETRNEKTRHAGDAINRESNQAESQKHNAHEVALELAPGDLKGGGEKQWRQDHQEHKLGIEADAWKLRNQAQQ